jgi:hypothetical protein
MPSLEAMVNQRVALKARRDAALAVVCERAGVAVPAIPDAGRPKPLAQYANFDLEADTVLAELVLGLAGKVDQVRADMAALSGKKGSK